jgi:YVTN family beta-propeller protein
VTRSYPTRVRSCPFVGGRPRSLSLLALLGIVGLIAAACSSSGGGETKAQSPGSSAPATTAAPTTAPPPAAGESLANVYQYTQANQLAPSVRDIPTRVYVPNGMSNTVDVIDPNTFTIIDSYPVKRLPQHVVPSWDMQTLYVNNNQGNTLTPIDPRSGKPGPDIPIDAPYNLYFSPDGTKAIIMAERNNAVDFYDPKTWTRIKSLRIPHPGVNHADFTADGKTMVASCEFSGFLVRIDLDRMEITGELNVGGKPVDVKLSPDGSVMFNANETRDGVSIVDWANMRDLGFIPTGKGAHGLYPSRDGTKLYVTNRGAGSVTVIDFATRNIEATWQFGGSPDMGGVSSDGTQLWLSGRYNSEVYVLDTTTGQLIRRIPVGNGPHGLALFPQPGRYSMGHTGNYR